MQIERIARGALAGLVFTTIVAAAREARAVCGDGTIDGTESCDDGNANKGDGCNQNCQTEAGYVCTGSDASRKDLCCFEDAASAYDLQGDATLNSATGEVTLVPNEKQKVGVAWFRQPLDFSRPFKVALRLYLGTNDQARTDNAEDSGADGGSILFQRAARPLEARGEPGKELGARGISPVFGVEFDTYNNRAEQNDLTSGDEDHVSVFHTSTAAANQLTPPTCLNPTGPCADYEDGKYHTFAVEWTGNTGPDAQHVRVFVDGLMRIDLTRDVVGQYFGNDPAGIYFGFAASTGESTNLHKFCPAAPEGFMVPRDLDGDGVDDSIDRDDDGDGRIDGEETGAVFGNVDPSSDPDNDGIPAYQDPDYWAGINRPGDCPDVVAPFGACDRLPDAVDNDHDGVPDHLDGDSDDDTVDDVVEDGKPDVAPKDGKVDNCMADAQGVCAGTWPPPPDSNNDGIINSRDPCVPEPTVPACMRFTACVDPNAVACGLANPAGDRDADTVRNDTECASAQSCPDSDGDGSRDFNDADSDGDGTPDQFDPDRLDPCRPDPKASRCASGDADSDGLSNGVECPTPPACVDTNGDGVADYLDPDQDDDGIYDGMDAEPRNPCVPNPQALACGTGDLDRDGFVGAADPDPRDPCVPDRNVVACKTGDADGDGIPNGVECPNIDACVDTDRDGLPDWNDIDSNNDNVNDGVDDRPELAGGACSTSAGGGAGFGLFVPVLLATWLGRRWRRRQRV